MKRSTLSILTALLLNTTLMAMDDPNPGLTPEERLNNATANLASLNLEKEKNEKTINAALEHPKEGLTDKGKENWQEMYEKLLENGSKLNQNIEEQKKNIDSLTKEMSLKKGLTNKSEISHDKFLEGDFISSLIASSKGDESITENDRINLVQVYGALAEKDSDTRPVLN